MLIYLLRHADAVQNSSLHDSERPLSDLGKQQASTVGEFLRDRTIGIDAVVSSPLLRAIETSEIVRTITNTSRFETTEYLVPGTRKSQLYDLINSIRVRSILLTGHEPHLSQTISDLLSGSNGLPIEIKKCSLACLVASEPVRSGHALLQWLMTNEYMAKTRY